MRTIDLTRLHGVVVGLELMAFINGRDDDVTVLCRTSEQARLVRSAIDRAKKKGTTAVNAAVVIAVEGGMIVTINGDTSNA